VLEVAMTIVGFQEIAMPRILGHLDQLPHRDVRLADVQLEQRDPPFVYLDDRNTTVTYTCVTYSDVIYRSC
jgi:hypothetical protein